MGGNGQNAKFEKCLRGLSIEGPSHSLRMGTRPATAGPPQGNIEDNTLKQNPAKGTARA